MPLPRRQFLRTGLGLGALLALGRTGRTAAALTASPSQPRGLLFDAADLPRIRANVLRPEFRDFWTFMTTVDFAAEEKFLKEELRFANHIVDMSRAQTIMLRSAFVNLLMPDPKHVAIARLALARLLGYPTWDWLRNSRQEHVSVMRGAGTCIGLALAAEWLAAELSADEQAAITQGMATEGGPSCYRGLHDMTHHTEVGPWSLMPGEEGLPPIDVARWPRILDETNLRIICTAGLAAATCHLWERHPDAPKWLAQTRDSLKLYASRQPKDGSFDEGIGYWDYTFTHYCFALEILRRRLGIDDTALLDFPAMARYTQEMTMPTAGHPDDCITIGDAGTAAGAVPLTWIARNFRNAGAQYLVLQPGTIRPTWVTCWAAVWYDPALPAQLDPGARLDFKTALGIIVSRTGFAENDTVVTLRSGGPVNHEHADRNSIIFKAHGERLLNDPVHAAYSTKDPKWLLRQTEAHTSVLINGKGHIYHDGHDGTNSSPAAATVQDYRVGPGWMTATSDATDAYRRAGLPTQLVQRTVIYMKPDVLAVFDRVLLDEALPVQVRFQVFNDDGAGKLSVDGPKFTISRPHATLRAGTSATAVSTLAAGKLALPDASGVYPFAELRSASACEHTLLTVCSAAPIGEAHGELMVKHEAGTWRISGLHRGQRVDATLRVAERVSAPVIEIAQGNNATAG